MLGHLRGSLLLLLLTVLVTSVLYPLIVWGIARTAFPEQAEGSLLLKDGKTVGSRLIAQPFTRDEYFWPRPSAASYKADASGGSNWGASNPKLRDRVARTLGPIVRYAKDEVAEKKGKPVGPDIEEWFRTRTDPKNVTEASPDLVTEWPRTRPTSAVMWLTNANAVLKSYVEQWAKDHPEVEKEWRKDNPGAGDPKTEELGPYFFASFAAANPGKWPAVDDKEKKVKLVTGGSDIQATFFDPWWQAVHADPKGVPPRLGHVPRLEKVPADLVMASGSGLDPHITHRNAHYQAPRVAEARKKTLRQVEELVDRMAELPMKDLTIAGPEKLLNVLELNLALDRDLGK